MDFNSERESEADNSNRMLALAQQINASLHGQDLRTQTDEMEEDETDY